MSVSLGLFSWDGNIPQKRVFPSLGGEGQGLAASVSGAMWGRGEEVAALRPSAFSVCADTARLCVCRDIPILCLASLLPASSLILSRK